MPTPSMDTSIDMSSPQISHFSRPAIKLGLAFLFMPLALVCCVLVGLATINHTLPTSSPSKRGKINDNPNKDDSLDMATSPNSPSSIDANTSEMAHSEQSTSNPDDHECSTAVDDSQNNSFALQKEIKTLEESLEALKHSHQTSMESLQVEESYLQKEVGTLKEDCLLLQSQKDTVKESLEKTQGDFNTKMESLHAEKSTLQEQVATLKEESALLQNQNADLKQSLETMAGDHHLMMASLRGEESSMQKKVSTLKEECSSLENQKVATKKSLGTVMRDQQSSIESLRAEESTLKKQVGDLKEESTVLQNQKLDLKESLEKIAGDFNTKMALLKAEKTTLEENIKSLTQTHKDTMASLEAEKLTLQKEVNPLRNDCKSLREEKVILRKNLEKTSRDYETRMGAVYKKEQTLEKHCLKLKEDQDKVQHRSNELDCDETLFQDKKRRFEEEWAVKHGDIASREKYCDWQQNQIWDDKEKFRKEQDEADQKFDSRERRLKEFGTELLRREEALSQKEVALSVEEAKTTSSENSLNDGGHADGSSDTQCKFVEEQPPKAESTASPSIPIIKIDSSECEPVNEEDTAQKFDDSSLVISPMQEQPALEVESLIGGSECEHPSNDFLEVPVEPEVPTTENFSSKEVESCEASQEGESETATPSGSASNDVGSGNDDETAQMDDMLDFLGSLEGQSLPELETSSSQHLNTPSSDEPETAPIEDHTTKDIPLPQEVVSNQSVEEDFGCVAARLPNFSEDVKPVYENDLTDPALARELDEFLRMIEEASGSQHPDIRSNEVLETAPMEDDITVDAPMLEEVASSQPLGEDSGWVAARLPNFSAEVEPVYENDLTDPAVACELDEFLEVIEGISAPVLLTNSDANDTDPFEKDFRSLFATSGAEEPELEESPDTKHPELVLSLPSNEEESEAGKALSLTDSELKGLIFGVSFTSSGAVKVPIGESSARIDEGPTQPVEWEVVQEVKGVVPPPSGASPIPSTMETGPVYEEMIPDHRTSNSIDVSLSPTLNGQNSSTFDGEALSRIDESLPQSVDEQVSHGTVEVPSEPIEEILPLSTKQKEGLVHDEIAEILTQVSNVSEVNQEPISAVSDTANPEPAQSVSLSTPAPASSELASPSLTAAQLKKLKNEKNRAAREAKKSGKKLSAQIEAIAKDIPLKEKSEQEILDRLLESEAVEEEDLEKKRHLIQVKLAQKEVRDKFKAYSGRTTDIIQTSKNKAQLPEPALSAAGASASKDVDHTRKVSGNSTISQVSKVSSTAPSSLGDGRATSGVPKSVNPFAPSKFKWADEVEEAEANLNASHTCNDLNSVALTPKLEADLSGLTEEEAALRKEKKRQKERARTRKQSKNKKKAKAVAEAGEA